MAASTLDRTSRLSRQPSVEDIEDDHFRQARLRREARNPSPGGWRYKRSLYVDDSERNVRSDLDNPKNPSLRSDDCAVHYERSPGRAGVNLIIQSNNEGKLQQYTKALREHYTRPSKPSQQDASQRNKDEIFEEILHVNLKNLRKQDIEEDLSDPSLQSKYCTFAIQPANGGWDIVLHSRDKNILAGYFKQLQQFYTSRQAPESGDLQKALMAALLPDGSNLSDLIARGLKVPGTGIPGLAARHRDESHERIASAKNPVSNPLPRRPTLSASNSRDGSPASGGLGRKSAQIGSEAIHRQTIRLQGEYKGDLSPGRASAWLTELSEMCKEWRSLSAVTIESNQDVGNTINFSGFNKDLNAACSALKHHLLVTYNRPEIGKWRLVKASGALDIYEWCPAPPPLPRRLSTGRRGSLRPQSSTPSAAPLPRRASVQVSKEPQYGSRRPSVQQDTPLLAPLPRGSVRHVSGAEMQNILPRRASSATNPARREPHREPPAERTVHVYGIDRSGKTYPTAAPSIASNSTGTGNSVFTASSRASTSSSAPSSAPYITTEIVHTKSRGSVRVEHREPARRVSGGISRSSTFEQSTRSSSSERRPSVTTSVKVIRTRSGKPALSRPSRR